MAGNRFQQAFRALRHRNFQLFWVGQGVSVAGTWMQSTAQSWLLYRLTNSPLALGIFAVVKFGPALAIAPFAGILADRLPRRHLLIVTQSFSLLIALALSILTLSHRITVSHIMALAFFQGCIDATDMTIRQTFQMDLVGAEDLQSAVSLNSAAFNSARMIGPPLAGFLTAHYGEGVCFAINALSYLAVLFSLLVMRTLPQQALRGRISVAEEIRLGFQYAWQTLAIRRTLIAVACGAGLGHASYTLAPAFAKDVLGAGSQGYGNLLLGVGVGSIAGSLLGAAMGTSQRGHVLNAFLLLAQGVSVLLFGFSRSLLTALCSLVCLGFINAMHLSTCNSSLQTQASPSFRGRVMSLYVWLLHGLTPLGGFAIGWWAQQKGISHAILTSGLACLVAGTVFYLFLPKTARVWRVEESQ